MAVERIPESVLAGFNKLKNKTYSPGDWALRYRPQISRLLCILGEPFQSSRGRFNRRAAASNKRHGTSPDGLRTPRSIYRSAETVIRWAFHLSSRILLGRVVGFEVRASELLMGERLQCLRSWIAVSGRPPKSSATHFRESRLRQTAQHTARSFGQDVGARYSLLIPSSER